MTKDGRLVAIHDATVDRTTDGSGEVNDMMLAEVQALDAGYNFEDLDGDVSFRGKGVTIPTVEEIFSVFKDTDMLFNVEIKDTNDPGLYRDMVEVLWGLIMDDGLRDRVITVSFEQDIVDMMRDVSEGEALVAGGRGEI